MKKMTNNKQEKVGRTQRKNKKQNDIKNNEPPTANKSKLGESAKSENDYK